MKDKTSQLSRTFSLVFLVFQTLYATTSAKDFKDSEVSHIRYPSWFKGSFLNLEEDLNEARENGKLGLMVLFTTEGCSYCDVFIQRSLGDPELASMVQAHFDSIGLEIFDDAEMVSPKGETLRIKQFANQQGVEYSPTLFFYGDKSEPLIKMVGYQSPERFRLILDYLIGHHYDSESFRDYAKRLEATTASIPSDAELTKDPLFMQPPYALDRSHFPAEKPLLVIFEKVACKECEEFHEEVLSLAEVRRELENFEVARFDAVDDKTPVVTPDGKRLTPLAWFEQTGLTRVPGLLFFDEHGNEVLKTDALVLRQRMMNSLGFVLEKAYEKGWTYQRFARTRAIARQQNKQE